MFKHLLVPLDGSHLAEAALPAARFLARSFGAGVTLVHLMEKGRPQTVHDQPHLHDANEAAAYLSRVAASFPAGVPVDWHVHEDEVRRVAASIVEHCMKELHSDLVIMCAHGEGGTRRFVQSSIAQQVTAFGTVPVLVLHAEQSSHREFACNKVLMPVEAGQQHGDIFGIAEKFATSCAAVVRLISVAPTNGTIKGKWLQVGRLLPGATAELLDLEADQLGEFLGSKASALRAAGVTAETAVLRGDPGPVISLDAEESRADIIVMATHGKSGMSALWEGSVASRVFAESKSPLLLVPVAVTP